MGNYLRSFFIGVLFFVSSHMKATHVMGGYIEYKCLGQDSFEITVNIYKDCKGVSLGSAITLKVDGIGCNFKKSYSLSKVNCGDITPVCKKSCSKCDRSNCDANGYPNGSNASCTFPYGIEKLVFKKNIAFKNTGCCKFLLSYSQCCRNGAVTTCCAGERLYIYSELDRCVSPQNSSPQITYDPLSMLCVGNCINMNLGVIDTINHDSISYQLASALNDSGSNCSYQGSYSYQYPLYYDGFPSIKKYNPTTCKGISLDSITGDLMFKPMQQQVTTIAMDIKEWRRDSNCNMKLIGVLHLDFMLTIVANCTNKPPTLAAASPIFGFAGDKICLNNIQSSDSSSKDTVRISWNNSIPNATFTTSFPNGSKKQQFDFCWQTSASDTNNTSYFFTAYAKDDACPLEGRTMRAYSITVGKKPEVSHQIIDLGCGNIKLVAAILNKKQKTCPDIYNFQWHVDGILYNGNNITVNIKKGGNIYIELVVGVNGFSLYTNDSITVQPYVNIEIGKDTFVCIGSSFNIKSTVANGSPPYKYKWLQGGLTDTLDNFTITPKKSIDVVCKIIDNMGCQNFDTIHLNVMPLPVFDVKDQRKCTGDTIFFDAYTANGNIINYKWKDILTGNIVSNNRYYQTSTQQFLNVSLTDSLGCIGYDNVFAFYNPPLNTFAGPDRIQCIYGTIALTTKGVDYANWAKFSDTSIIHTGTNYINSFDSNTTLVLHGYKTLGGVTCKGYDTLNITIAPKPIIALPTNYINCKDANILLQTLGHGSYKYKWNTGDTTYYTKVSKTGYYTVTAIDTNGCIDSATTQLNNFPSQQVSISIVNDTLYANNTNFVIYDWYYNTTYDTTTIAPWRYITQLGDYTVAATDSNGCVDTSKVLAVNTLKSGIYTTPNPYGIKVYPNPSTGLYYIESPIAIHDFTIYDLTGRRIFYNGSNNMNTIDLSGQPEGIYLLQINKNVWVRLAKL